MKGRVLAITAAMIAATGAAEQANASSAPTRDAITREIAITNASTVTAGALTPSVTSAAERDTLRGLTGGGRTDAEIKRPWPWIGGAEASRTFPGTSGSPIELSYSFWYPGKPTDDGDALPIGEDGGFASWNNIAADAVFGYVVEFSGPAVPEPSTWALMILGFGAVGGAMRRRSATIAIT